MNKKKTWKGRTAMNGEASGISGNPVGAANNLPAPLHARLEKYRRHVAHFDLPDHKKDELLLAVWNIMQSFVDRAFGEDAAQLAPAHVEKLQDDDEDDDSAVVPSPHVSAFNHSQRLSGAFGRNARNRDDNRKDRS